ncbi:MAG: 50S ribosomal protein L25 [Chloroflexi bacterium]|nr:50S ribosomal protein L25 [Chloroflexota bacterium]HCU80080.1 50S ribosomal protein L25 [Chloroflexota bacterium]|tara:strand:- start:1633 stop:2322 length:690 start_codon:yes stop_codon:yes gene_type:complete
MESTLLKAQTRTVISKGLNRLRRDGLLPGVLYGTNMDPIALQLPAHEAGQILTRLQGTVLIDLEVDGQNHTTIVRELQKDVLKGNPLHVDFMAVDMEQVLTITVPITLVGESPAVATGEYAVMTSLYDLEVECLPKDIINSIEVSVEGLTDLGDTILVSDVNVPEGVNILTDLEEAVARVAYAGIVEVEEEETDEEGLELDAEDVEVIEKGKGADDDFEEASDNDESTE